VTNHDERQCAQNLERFPALKEIGLHPACAIFPMMSEEELNDLAFSIKANGLRDPITLDEQGRIVDGKCRYEACKRAGVEPRFKPMPEGWDPWDFVISMNVLRVGLNKSQKEIAAAIAWRDYGVKGVREPLPEARLVARHPHLVEMVMEGGMSLNRAYEIAGEREREAIRDAEKIALLRRDAPFLALQVDDGEMTLDQAIVRAVEVIAAPQLAEHVIVIRSLGRRMMADALEIGRRLAECRRLIGHGDWIGWLDRELGVTDRSALNFMRLYQLSLNRSENFADLNLPVSGLYLLAQPSTSDAVRDDVLERAAKGETISIADIRRAVSAEKPLVAPSNRLAKIAEQLEQLANEHPDDPLVKELQALVSKIADRDNEA
jgi:hypothetical protein